MSGTDLVGDYVVLHSDIQDAYHVERREQYQERGKTDGNWLVVDQAGSYVEGLLLAGERRQTEKDKPR